MFLLIIIITLLIFIAGAAKFARSTKEWPKSWYEWKAEMRYQYIGIVGLVQDFRLRSRDRVALYKQPDRIAVITGGNRGIGLRVIEKLLACDMTVIMGVRDPSSATKAVSAVTTTNGKLVCEKLDIGDLTSVKEFAEKIKQKYDRIDILINNAGIMFAPYKITEDGFESHLAINYLGHFLLTHLLLPLLKAAGKEDKYARIVNVSSLMHIIGRINYKDINATKYYYPGDAYSQTKLAQLLSTRHMQHMLDAAGAHVQVIAIHPGIVDTDLFEYSSTTSVPMVKKLLFKTPEQGSRTIVYAAIDPKIEGKGGLYLSNCCKAPMHPAAKSPEKCERLFKFSCDLLHLKPEDFGNGRI